MMRFRFDLKGTSNYAKWDDGDSVVWLHSGEGHLLDKAIMYAIPTFGEAKEMILAAGWADEITDIWLGLGNGRR